MPEHGGYLMRLAAFPMALLSAATSTSAQDAPAGRVANSAVGQAGQRQTREQPVIGIEPMTRVNSRIQNRVQSRVRNRVDRFYNPQANVASPFEVASDQVRTTGSLSRR